MTLDPRLSPLVDAARRQVAEPSLGADALFRTWDRRRRTRTVIFTTSAVFAAAAALAVLMRSPSATDPRKLTPDASLRAAAPSVGQVEQPERPAAAVLREAAPVLARFELFRAPLMLASPAAVALNRGATRTPVSVWRHAAAGFFMRASNPGELDRRAMEIDPETLARALARRAEAAISVGRRADAVRLLQTLLRRHPKSSPARSAMLDLGRLLEARGQVDEARCAYRELIRRWPYQTPRVEIELRLERLGPGPACERLRPL